MEITKEEKVALCQLFGPHVSTLRMEEIFQEAIAILQIFPVIDFRDITDRLKDYAKNEGLWRQIARAQFPSIHESDLDTISQLYDRWLFEIHKKKFFEQQEQPNFWLYAFLLFVAIWITPYFMTLAMLLFPLPE